MRCYTLEEYNMKRKIIKQGHNTLTITLPAEWTKRFNLEAGKDVDLDERDNGLFISTEKNGKTKVTEFDITGMDVPTIWKYFMAVYREGYSEVMIKFDPQLQFESPYKFLTQHRLDKKYHKQRDKISAIEALQGFVNRFIDFEIVEHDKNYVLVREMGELTSKEFDNSLRRIFLLIQQMSEDSLEAIKSNNPKIVTHMHDVDINLDKFHDYCIRILNRVGNKEPRKTSLLFSTLYLMELIGDEFKNIATHMIHDYQKVKMKTIEPFMENVHEMIEVYYDLFYKFDKKKIGLLSDLDKKTYFNIPSIYRKSTEQEKEIYHHFRMIERYLNALIELRIEMEF